MRFFSHFSLRVLEAVVITFAVFGLLLCLSHLPGALCGPWGYGKAVPSRGAGFLMHLVPTTWFCYAISPFAFWAVFRQGGDRPNSGLRAVMGVVALFLGAVTVILSELIALHAAYAVEPQSPSPTTVVLNVLLLVGLYAFLAVQEWQRKTRVREQ